MNVNAKPDNARPVDDKRSHHVRPQDLPWEKMRFPGCQTKTLLFDPKSGLATVLIKMEPGATLPDHEHVLIEQTYVLDGSLVDKEGPDAGLEVGPGEFVWRPAGSRHVAWCPNGRHDDCDLPGAEQIFRKERPGDRCWGQGLAVVLGTHLIELA